MSPIHDLLGDTSAFIESINDGLRSCGISRSEIAMMDHVCYRVETEARYREVYEKLKQFGVLLGENSVNGRPIATFEFNEYIQAAGWAVPYIELPAPKEDSFYAEGLEHAELVVIGSLERFMARHVDLPFSRKGLGKIINPEAVLKAEGTSVKFHEQQLGAVVRIERDLLNGESR